MSGKVYSGEKAVISLTSWKKRIDTVGLTLFSLLKQCPGFHIVLVLSEEEFPKKEAELPLDLIALVNAKKIEVMWVPRNLKNYKKLIYAMHKYNDIPIISADDDCIYKYNYAEELYQMWCHHKTSVIAETVSEYGAWGYGTLHPPHSYNLYLVEGLANLLIQANVYDDDKLYYFYNTQFKNVEYISLHHKLNDVVITGNGVEPLTATRNNEHTLTVMGFLFATLRNRRGIYA